MVLPSASTLVSTLVLFGLLFAVLRRPWITLLLTLYVLGFVLVSSFVKQAYLGMALTVADVYFFLLRPIENFHLFANYPLLALALAGVLGGFVVCLLLGLKLERPVRLLTRPRVGGWLRISTVAVSLTIAIVAGLIASPESRARVNDKDAYAAFLAMYAQQDPDGIVDRLNIFFDNRSFEAELPKQVAQTRFATITSPASSPSPNRQPLPDILLILEESTFDPNLIDACMPKYCDDAMLHPLKSAQRTRQGPLLVHSTGGGTWLTEFAVLSGFDWRVFGRGGAFAPVSLAPRLQTSLPLHLHALGYRTVAVYPTDGDFLSATSAYRHYGFDEFYDARQLGLPKEWGDTSDAMVLAKALQVADRPNDPRPVFVFMLTIRNHGPHGSHPEKIPAAFKPAISQTGVYLADYLARMRDSSNAYVQAASRWLASPRPRVVAWFGDHQPEAAWDYTAHPQRLRSKRLPDNVTDKQLQYLTRFQFGANFGAASVRLDRDALDVSYLGAELLGFAGIPLNAGEHAALQAAHLCDGLMLTCDNRPLIDDYLSYRIHELGAIR